MTPRSLAAVGIVLKSVTLEQAQELARPALTDPDALDMRSWVRAKLPILEELGL
jgi:phosphotransferase system enzyme I (PtsI)